MSEREVNYTLININRDDDALQLIFALLHETLNKKHEKAACVCVRIYVCVCMV